jgi:hypothetical protein
MEIDQPRRVVRRCGVCNKALGAAANRDGLCEGCLKAFQRIYGNDTKNTENTNMAKKSKKSAQTETTTDETSAIAAAEAAAAHADEVIAPKPETRKTGDGKVRRVHRVEAPATVDAGDASVHAAPTETTNGASSEDNTAALETGTDTPTPGGNTMPEAAAAGRFAWLKKNNAQRALDTAVKTLSKYDFTEWGIDGVSGAVAILKNASAKFAAQPKKTTKGATVTAGATANVREKFVAHYDGVIEPEHMRNIKVNTVLKGHARCQTAAGEQIVLPVAHLEVAS